MKPKYIRATGTHTPYLTEGVRYEVLDMRIDENKAEFIADNGSRVWCGIVTNWIEIVPASNKVGGELL